MSAKPHRITTLHYVRIRHCDTGLLQDASMCSTLYIVCVSRRHIKPIESSGVLLRKSSISAFGVENIGGFVIMDFSGTVTSGTELPKLSVAFWARDGAGRLRHVGNSLDFGYLHLSRPATFFALDFSLATTLQTGSHGPLMVVRCT